MDYSCNAVSKNKERIEAYVQMQGILTHIYESSPSKLSRDAVNTLNQNRFMIRSFHEISNSQRLTNAAFSKYQPSPVVQAPNRIVLTPRSSRAPQKVLWVRRVACSIHRAEVAD